MDYKNQEGTRTRYNKYVPGTKEEEKMSVINTVNGKTKVYGLIGHPIRHTLSPIIHNTLANMLRNDMIYVPFDVDPKGLEASLLGAYQLNIKGLNVTVPHKQEVIPFLSKVEGYAKQIGAVNTLKWCEDGYIGYNTDAEGLLMSLTENEIYIEDKNVLIIGAGGAARAASMMAAAKKPKQMIIANRTIEKAEQLARDVATFYDIPIKAASLNLIDCDLYFDLCIQTTSLGLHPQEDESPIKEDGFFNRVGAAVDLIYNPSETLFLKKAREAGCKTVNGFGMLFYQAIRAYEIWNEITVPKTYIDKLFQIIKDELNI